MEPIILVAGGPAVGKTTVARALAASFPAGVHIPVDELRLFVRSGLVLPQPSWPPDLVRQIGLARRSAIAMGLEYAASGFAVVIDDFWDPNHLAEYQGLLERDGVTGVLLHCAESEALRRLAGRAKGTPDPAEVMAVGHSQRMVGPALGRAASDGWLVLDTTMMNSDAMVAAIRAKVTA